MEIVETNLVAGAVKNCEADKRVLLGENRDIAMAKLATKLLRLLSAIPDDQLTCFR